MSKTYQITVIAGDGIGPEVVEEAVKLLDATGLKFDYTQAYAGYSAFQKFGTPLPDETIKVAKKSDAILFGAVTTPPNIPNYFSPIVRLRKLLNLYANVRPMVSLPIESIQQEIDFTIIRENTEDLYMGLEHETDDGAIAERVITKKGSEQIIRYAFEYAKKMKRKKITLVHKANVLRITDGLFISIGKTIAKEYLEITYEEMLVDNCAMQIVKNPKQFEVIVTTNMFGDILSDESAALVGGLGVASSANIGDKNGLFEPVHGSAPKYVGKNQANPLATFFAACLMLNFLGKNKVSNKIRAAIFKALQNKQMTKDLGGKLTTTEFTKTVIDLL